MAIHLDVRHPSPVAALPRRGRRERHGFEALTTPVAIEEAHPDAFVPMKALEWGPVAQYGMHRFEDATWSELASPSGGRPFTLDDVLAFARGATHPEEDKLAGLREALRFTPLHAGGIDARRSHVIETDMSLGDPLFHLDGPALGRVVREERERTAANLRTWVAGNLRASGERMMVRTPPLIQVMQWGGAINVYSANRVSLSPNVVEGLRPDRARALCASIGRPFDDEGMEAGLGMYEEWTRGLCTDDDVRMVVERFPGLVAEMTVRALAAPADRRRVHAPQEATAAIDALRPWILRGACGGIPLDEAPDAFQASLAAIQGLRNAGVPLSSTLEAPGGIVEHCRRWYLSRIDEVAPEDAEALTMMA